MPPCKKRARPISVAQAVTGAGYHADRPDTAHGISILRAMLRSESEGDRASSRIQVRCCEFDLAFDRLEQHRTGAEIGPVGRCLAWLRTLGAND